MCQTGALAQQARSDVAATGGTSNAPAAKAVAKPAPRRLAQAATAAAQQEAAAAGPAPQAPAEPAVAPQLQLQAVVVTGSLIAGTTAIGVPVMAVTAQDYLNTGSLDIADAMKNIPSVNLLPSLTPVSAHNDRQNVNEVNIHGLGSLETLVLVNGMRTPVLDRGRFVSPDLVNPIAVEAVDVLPDGASATYGSDAVAGVVNVRLIDTYNGAKTQVAYLNGQGFGGEQIGQLVGKQWDGGGLVLSYEFTHQSPLQNKDRTAQNTDNFTSSGGLNYTPVGNSLPATLTIGKPKYANGVGGACSNCYAAPGGLGPGAIVNFADLQAGTNNEVNPYLAGDIIGQQNTDGATLAFHQQLNPSLEFFSDDYYQQRHNQTYFNTDSSGSRENDISVALPATGYPYLAPGYPTNLQVDLDSQDFLASNIYAGETDYRYNLGLRFVLPKGWSGTVQYAESADTEMLDMPSGQINVNNMEALLGEPVTIASPVTGQTTTVSLPSSIPVFDVFCDPTKYSCMSQSQLNFINAFSDETDSYYVRELNATVNGSLFHLPGGEVRLAVGADYDRETYQYEVVQNNTSVSVQQPLPASANDASYSDMQRGVWSFFGQLNVPLVGQNNEVMLAKRVTLQLSGRYDHYSDFGSTANPKLALNWTPTEGLIVSGSWGTSFHAPTLADESNVGQEISGVNGIPGSGSSLGAIPNCLKGATSPVPGSAGAEILAATGGTCASDPYSYGLDLKDVSVANTVLGPETAKNWTLGVEFAPPQITGLDVNVTYYNVEINNVLGIITSPNELVDPQFTRLTAVLGQPGFLAAVDHYLSIGTSQLPYSAATAAEIDWMEYGGYTNLGKLKQNGLDFNLSYTLPEFLSSTWKVGAVGSYTFHQYYSSAPGEPMVDIAGTNTTGPEGEGPLRLYMRDFIGWSRAGVSVTAFANYQSGYTNTTTDSYPGSAPAYTTMDLSAGYDFGAKYTTGFLSGLKVNLEVSDVFNQGPSLLVLESTGTGSTYDPYRFNDIFRTINLTLSEDW